MPYYDEIPLSVVMIASYVFLKPLNLVLVALGTD